MCFLLKKKKIEKLKTKQNKIKLKAKSFSCISLHIQYIGRYILFLYFEKNNNKKKKIERIVMFHFEVVCSAGYIV